MKRRHGKVWPLAAVVLWAVASATVTAVPANAAAVAAEAVTTDGSGPAATDASAVLEAVVDNLRGGPMRGTQTFVVERPGRITEYVMEIVTDGGERGLIRIVAPPREAGQAFLMDGDDLWLYNPRLGRSLRLPPSGRSGAFLGSDVSYNDIVGRDLENDYIAAFAETEGETAEGAAAAGAPEGGAPAGGAPEGAAPEGGGPEGGAPEGGAPEGGGPDGVIVLELTPRPGAPTPYGRVVVGVDGASLTPRWIDYYDQRGQVVKRLTLAEYLEAGQRRVPQLMVVEDRIREGYRTVVRLDDVVLDAAVPETCFTLQALERGCP